MGWIAGDPPGMSLLWLPAGDMNGRDPNQGWGGSDCTMMVLAKLSAVDQYHPVYAEIDSFNF
eukprot:7502794-Ditylum_brightwellii.AAC.1